uniref:Uncharacterized protein n=1 Tax=Plectus sambesii TaxID=2011161 RepID=A0A914X222_9BILA
MASNSPTTNLRSSDDEDWIDVKKPDDAMNKSNSTQSASTHSAAERKPAAPFKEKEFKIRNSLLTDLFQSSDIAVIYNFFFAILVLLMLNTIAKDALEQGSLNLDLWLVWWNFGRFPLVMTVWFAMFASTCTVMYPLFRWWAHKPSAKVDSVSQAPWIGMYIAYIMAMFYFPLRFLFSFELPIASSFIITCENVRILMKVHAFIRENAPRATAFKIAAANYKKNDQNSAAPVSQFPSMDKLIYFIFCPTFIYRDEYPRTATCDWWIVCKYFLQCLGSILYTAFIFTRFCIPIFEKIDYHTVTIPTMILSIFPSILPGAFCLLLLFWGLLHCCMEKCARIHQTRGFNN